MSETIEARMPEKKPDCPYPKREKPARKYGAQVTMTYRDCSCENIAVSVKRPIFGNHCDVSMTMRNVDVSRAECFDFAKHMIETATAFIGGDV